MRDALAAGTGLSYYISFMDRNSNDIILNVFLIDSCLSQVKVVSEPERIEVFLTRSCVQVTDISCGVVYEATLASLVLFRRYCYVF